MTDINLVFTRLAVPFIPKYDGARHQQIDFSPSIYIPSVSSNRTKLHIGAKSITSIPDLRALTQLEYLNLNANKITSVSSDKLPGSLRHLELCGNRLTRECVEDLTAMTQLREIHLGSNRMKTIPRLSFGENLLRLNISFNSFTTLHEDTFDSLINLRRLEFSNNPSPTLPSGIFRHLTSLTYLDLGYNQFSELPNDIFEHLTSLVTLNLRNNALVTLPSMVTLTNLKMLHIEYNSLETIEKSTFDNTKKMVYSICTGGNPVPLDRIVEKIRMEINSDLTHNWLQLRKWNRYRMRLVELAIGLYAMDLPVLVILTIASHMVIEQPEPKYNIVSWDIAKTVKHAR